MNEQHNSLEEAIEALKAQINDGEDPDFSDFDSAVTSLSEATAGLKKAIVKNTEFEASNQ